MSTSAELLTIAQAAERTGRHADLLRRWCRDGRLPAHRIGRDWLIRPADLGAIAEIERRQRVCYIVLEGGPMDGEEAKLDHHPMTYGGGSAVYQDTGEDRGRYRVYRLASE